MTTRKLAFFNVSIVMTPDDNGYCVTFDNAADARECADWHRSNGAWHVSVWS
jgi:hypothetical protein